ncbi:hypothetical protein N7G274_010401 [Stereocaulon virgatum]|uniref:Nucleotide exchange factor SIL1 n=1 Tax=Stereocaulon virgatum TaxID=373712 RepID=A0ABR3ZVT4_9LECA
MFKYTLFALPASLLLFLTLSTAQAKAPPVPSPEAHTELICHTEHASECYPAIFQPTIHFKRVHDDQSLPPGLHVRMNLASGLKEARLNVPEPNDTARADLVIIDDVKPRPKTEEEEEEREGLREIDVETDIPPIERIHDQSTPDRDYPYIPDAFDAEESTLFHSATDTLLSSPSKDSPETLLSTLTTLTDLCHSYHWGLTLTRSPLLVQKLLSILNPPSSSPELPNEIRSHTALLLGTAIQNNPEARSALFSTIPINETIQTILSILREPIPPSSPSALHPRTLFLLNQLSYSPPFLHSFLLTSGLETLRTTLLPHLPNNPKIRLRLSHFLLDHAVSALTNPLEPTQYELAIEIAKTTVAGGIPSSEEARRRHWGEELVEGKRALMVIFEPWCRVLMEVLNEGVGYPKTISDPDAVPASKSLGPDEKVKDDIMFLLFLKMLLEIDTSG